MTDELVPSFVHALSERERRLDHPDALQQFKIAYQQLVEAAQRAERSQRNQFLNALTDGFAQAESNWAFGALANTCGIIVEQGGVPSLALEPILDRLTLQLLRVPEFVRIMQEQLGVEQPNRVAPGDWQTLGQAHPEFAWVIGEWHAINFVGGAAMTMLCRDVELRKRGRERIELVRAAESVRSDQPYAYYLAEVLDMVDDECLLVLDTTRKLGFRVRLTAVRNNFQLFTLLQDALVPPPPSGGGILKTLAVSIAKSERMLSSVAPSEWTECGEHDVALWSFNSWMATPGQDPTHWLWGEMKPTEIPMLDGERIVLLGPLELPRSWEIAFFVPLHSALRSSVRIEETLSRAVYEEWIGRIRTAVPQ